MGTINRKPKYNAMQELPISLMAFTSVDGETRETAMNVLADALNELVIYAPSRAPGELAQLGAGLSLLGDYLTGIAKDKAEAAKLEEDGEVGFTIKQPYEQTKINNDYVKEQFPKAEYPEVYSTTTVKGSVLVDLPFQKKLVGVK